MKKLFILSGIIISATAFKTIADDLSKYGISSAEVKKATLENINNDYISVSEFGVKNLQATAKKLSPSDRAMLTKTLGLFVKTYITSASFQEELDKSIDASKQDVNPNSADWKATYQNEYNNNIQNANTLISSGILNDQYFATMESMLQGYRQQTGMQTEPGMSAAINRQVKYLERLVALKPVYNSNKNEFAKKYAALTAQQKIDEDIASLKEQNDNLDKKKNYKANLTNLLQRFLDETDGVDYDAKTFKNGAFTEYVNEEYRSKPSIWKSAFRIGKPAMTVARQMAEEFKKELGK